MIYLLYQVISLIRCMRMLGGCSVVHHRVLVEEHSRYGMFFRFVNGKYISYIESKWHMTLALLNILKLQQEYNHEIRKNHQS